MKKVFFVLFILLIPVFSFAANLSFGGGVSLTDTLPGSNHLGNGFARINVGIRGFVTK